MLLQQGHSFHVTKTRLFGGATAGPEWQIVDAEQNSIKVKKRPLRHNLSFESEKGEQLATLTWGFISCSQLTWKNKTYK